ncbi:MAG: hypothetical protein ACHQ5A_02910 [Opitutales bacterium]
MKTLVMLPGLIALLLAGGLPAAESQNLPAPAEIQGLPCQGTVRFFANGRIAFCTLSRDQKIGDLLLPAETEVAFTPTGEWCEMLLGADATVFHLRLPAKSRVFAACRFGYPSIWPAHDMVIQGQLCTARDDGIGHYLYPSGRLRGVWLKKATVIDGVPCTSSPNPITMPFRVLFFGTVRMAWFHENGRLQQAMLARGCTIQGHAFKKGDIISLSPEGNLEFPAKHWGDETSGPVAPPWWPKSKPQSKPTPQQ